MGRRTVAQREIDAQQARARRRRARLKVIAACDCHATPDAFGTTPRPSELALLGEIAIHGGMQQAAICMGIAYSTAKNSMCLLYSRLGAVSAAHAMMLLGWTNVPVRLRRAHP